MPVNDESEAIGARVRRAVLWRSGSQLAGQLVAWGSTFLVVRMLTPGDYGLFAMTQLVLALTGLMNGYSFTGALVQAERIEPRQIAQVFGMLLLLNGALAVTQFALAPLAAAWFRAPMVADLLRVQCVLHLFTPFLLMPQALLSRGIDFRAQARVNLAAALLAAIAAPLAAWAGFGVWTLVAAPVVLFGARAVGLGIVARWWIVPSFRFKGAGAMAGFGGMMLAAELLWFVQTQADTFIAGRRLDPHALGLYAESLFLAQVLVNKFVPALNEVAFPAYSRLRDSPEVIAAGFTRSVRLVMLGAVPFSLGMAVTAGPLVLAVLGPRWAGAIPVLRWLGLAMPFATLQILYAPATNALGRPFIAARIAAAGAVLMPAAFLIGVRGGPEGMALAWLGAAPLLALIASALSLPAIRVGWRALAEAIRPAALAGGTMALGVWALDSVAPPLAPFARLLLLVPAGAALYALALLLFARGAVDEALGLLRRRAPVPA